MRVPRVSGRSNCRPEGSRSQCRCGGSACVSRIQLSQPDRCLPALRLPRGVRHRRHGYRRVTRRGRGGGFVDRRCRTPGASRRGCVACRTAIGGVSGPRDADALWHLRLRPDRIAGSAMPGVWDAVSNSEDVDVLDVRRGAGCAVQRMLEVRRTRIALQGHF